MDEEITAKEVGQVKKLLKENLELNQKIYEMVKSIKSYIFWQRVFGVLKILIIVIPIIIGIVYLPPLIKDALRQYQGLLNIGGNSLDLESLFKSGALGQ